MQHLRTCSDDEDFAVVGGASESSADTDELIGGHVDWTMAADSDDEMERYGWASCIICTMPCSFCEPLVLCVMLSTMRSGLLLRRGVFCCCSWKTAAPGATLLCVLAGGVSLLCSA